MANRTRATSARAMGGFFLRAETQFVIASIRRFCSRCLERRVLSIDEGQLRPINYRDTEHFRLTRDFLNAPERYHRHLFGSESSDDEE